MTLHRALFAAALVAASSINSSVAGASPVKLKSDAGNYQLLVDDKPFFIEGAGGSGSKPLLKAVGGNAFRLWGVDPDIDQQLAEANKLGLKVVVGIWLEHEQPGVSYQDAAFVQKQFDRAKANISKLKDNPAVLMWGIGNEMEGYQSGDDPHIWKAVNDIAKMAHDVDPNHPTMTVIAEIGGNKIKAFNEYAKDVDILGINSYAGCASIGKRYRAGGGIKPYIVTEFGPAGTWEVGKTDWGVAIEPTSTEKAASYKTSYENGILAEKDKLCLGSFAFTWGNKQETTGTWFGMLLPDGSHVGAVDVMEEEWTGKAPVDRVPTIEPMTVDNVTPGKNVTVNATVNASDPEGKALKADWKLMEEVEHLSVGGDVEAVPPDVANAVISSDVHSAKVKMPDKPGKYRLYVVIKDPAGNSATANVPILVTGTVEPGKEKLAMHAKLPLIVFGDAAETNPYIPSGWMGKTDAIAIDPNCTTQPHTGATCMKCDFKSADNFGGVVWQSPANDWGDADGGLDLTGAKTLTFWARGEAGGEKIQFKFGILEKSKTFFDTAGGNSTVTLGKTWKKYTIDVAGKDLRRIKTGFAWVVGDAGKPVTFYLDDIAYE